MAAGDSELLEAWRAGDPSAGEALFRRLFRPLRRFFANKVRERAHVEDLVATTFETLLDRRGAFEGRSSVRTFVLGIARNVLRTYYRQHALEGGTLDPESLSIVEMGAGPFSLVARAQEQQILLHALRRIPLRCQIVLELYFWEHMRGPRIAALLGIPVGTVRSRMRQGQEHLREELQRLADNPDLLHSTVHNLEDWAAGLRDSLTDAP